MTELAADLQRTLGDAYAIERELAPGGMSRLFVARDTALRRRVAIKVLPRSLVAVVSVDRFKREIMLAAALQHPHIVPVLSAGEIDGLPYYVMPFVEGESLRARIARGPLSVRETVSVMKDVARALAYAHAQGVIHRDVKPDNILLSAGAAMVADFGVAKAISAARVQGAAAPAAGATITGMGISLGTPAYMAPEQVTADPSVGHRADLYALGVVAYEMLAGAPPFRGRSAQQVLASHVAEQPVPITTRRYDVPDALADLVMACLQKDPALRPKAAADLVRALEDATTSSGAFEPPRLVPRITRRQRQRLAGLRRPALAAAAAVAVLAAVAWSVTRPDGSDSGPDAAGAATGPGAGSPAAAAPAAPRAAGIGVAVLPLANLGAERADSVLAQGLASAFIDALSGLAGVRVASHTASRAAADGAAGPAEIGRALGAAFLVEGTVQRQGERVRVTVRLVRADDGAALWSQALDRTAGGDLLALQDDVTRTVAAALAPRLGAPPATLPAPAAPAAAPADSGL